MRIIDAHTHVFPQYAALAVEVMDRCGVEASITLEWHDGFGDTLKKHMEIFRKFPGRFVVFGNVDWKRVNEPGFGETAAAQMAEDVKAGMRGIKVYKALGLDYRHTDSSWWRVNDPAFDPIWARAGELGIPILIHTADPMGFWQPINDQNFWNGVVYGEYEWWSYYRKGMPSIEELLGERNEVIARHPRAIFICPHVGSKSDCLDEAAEDLEMMPNLFYDISARAPVLGKSPRRASHAREFMIEFQDRIVFGTDAIYDNVYVPRGQQAQLLFQPGEVPLNGADPHARCVEESVACIRSHIDLLISRLTQNKPPFKRCRKGYVIHGLDLPEEVCARILHGNISRILGVR